eukprot:Awhi_evm1s13769
MNIRENILLNRNYSKMSKNNHDDDNSDKKKIAEFDETRVTEGTTAAIYSYKEAKL